MFGKKQATAPTRTGSFTNFFVRNILLLAISFIIALFGANYVLQYIGFIIYPLAAFVGALYPPLNDAFFLTYLMIYALISVGVWFFRYKTGSRI
jgi:hypothetical protein